MELKKMSALLFWSVFFQFTLLSCINLHSVSATTTTRGNETDRLALLAFKDLITDDPLEALSSWNHSLHFCEWRGVICSPRHQRVAILRLSGLNLVGSVSPHIANLTFLLGINLVNNSFHGNIPPEIGRLFRLQHLNLSQNSFQGPIPASLANCSDLRIIRLFDNELLGNIPVELTTLSNLVMLVLATNRLIGNLPPSLGNLSSLIQLSLRQNSLEGSFPNELGRIRRLEFLLLSQNRFTGTIPPSIFNISSIRTFGVVVNQLHGSLPPNIGLTLPNLREFLFGDNQFTGPIPVSLPNASGLVYIDLPNNHFSGGVPWNLASLQDLVGFNIGRNGLGTGEANDLNFFASLTNCTCLEILDLSSNGFGGVLPNSIANLSTQLLRLHIGGNQLSGSIPTGFDNLFNLMTLGMEKNNLAGHIPLSIGKLMNLELISLFRNGFSGPIPSSLGNITRLGSLDLAKNNLQGSIPSSLGNCRSLNILDLNQNNLSGSIPIQVISLSSLSIYLDLSQNSLMGSLPVEVGTLENIGELDLSDNKLSGVIASTLGNCLSLERLYLAGNFFQGAIPQSLSTLKGIQEIDLSRNNLSGQIPEYFKTFVYLDNLNLSFNALEGEVWKEGVFSNKSVFSIVGNNKLCGGIPELQLPACPVLASKKQGRSLSLKVTLPVSGFLLCLIFVSCFFATRYWIRNSRKKPPPTPSLLEGKLPKVSYNDLLKATGGFSSANMIGAGSYGVVYKGTFNPNETIVAVKVIDLQQRGASKSFTAECEALRNVRHRNLVKVLTSCSSVDFFGNDFKAIVLDFMPNGSLESWLHPIEEGQYELRNLNLIQRLNISIDVGSALDYLHNHGLQPIVHCDLKPSNILLDDGMVAHVSDFGLARFLSEASSKSTQNQSSSNEIKGTIGYVAPEYWMGGKASTYGDVYSYGVLLLEMFTGKRPTAAMFKEGISLHKFAKMAMSKQDMKIVDPILLSEAEGLSIDTTENHNNRRTKMRECVASIIGIGLSCSEELPRERMEMRDVVRNMHAIRDLYLGEWIHGEHEGLI